MRQLVSLPFPVRFAPVFLAVWLLCVAPVQAEPPVPVLATTSVSQIALLSGRVVASPLDADAQFDLAIAYARTPFPERAWEAMATVQTLDPDYARRAIEQYAAIVAAEPTNADARFRYATGLYFDGKRKAARYQLQTLVRRSPQDAWALTYLGWMQAEANQLDQAISTWQKAIAVDHDNAVAHWLLAQAHLRKGRSDAATDALKLASALRAAHPLDRH